MSLTESQRQKFVYNIMDDELKHFAQHAAQHAVYHAAKGAGCMVTLFAMLTGIGTISCIVGLIIMQ